MSLFPQNPWEDFCQRDILLRVIYSDPADQAEMLNSQFTEAFTKEDCNFMPQMGPGFSNTAPLIIQEKGVKKLLDSQNPHQCSHLRRNKI